MRSYKAHISTRKNSYAIRKFSIGIASILVGSALFFGYNQESHASLQVTEDSNSSTNNINADVVQSSGAITKQEGIQNTTQNESVEKVSNNVNEDTSLNNNVNLQNNQLLASEQASENNNLVGSSKSNEHQASGSEVSSDTSLETQSNNNVEETKASNTLNQPISNNTQSDLTTTLNNNEVSSQESNFDTKSVVSEKQKIYPAQVVRKNVNAHTKDVDVLKLIENNSKYLSEEERKLFLRMATRYSSFVSRDWNHIYNKNYNGISSNVNIRTIGSQNAQNTNKLLNSMYNLIESRDNDNFYAELTTDSKTSNLLNFYNLDRNIRNEDGHPVATLTLRKNTTNLTEYRGGRWLPWRVRYEQWGLRTNESLDKKIETVVAKYKWNGVLHNDVLTRNNKGFYWFKEDEAFSVNKANVGGTIDLIITFKKDAIIDKFKDFAWGYIISDSKELDTVAGANIGFEKLNFTKNNFVTVFNNNVLNNLKRKVQSKLENSTTGDSVNQNHYLTLLNRTTQNVTSSADYKRALLNLNNLYDRLNVVENEVKPVATLRKAVSSDSKIIDVFKYIEENEQYLSDEERKFFLRTAVRNTSLQRNDWEKLYNKDYNTLSSNVSSKNLTNTQAENANKTLNSLYDLIQNRNNDNFYKELTKDPQAIGLSNHFIVKNNVTQSEGHQLVDIDLSKNSISLSEYVGGKWLPWKVRYEQWGLRTNESLNNKIEQVKVKYRWNGKELERILERNSKGFYWFKEDEVYDVNKANVGGKVTYQIKFKKDAILDLNNDMAWGYIISDSKDLQTLTGANIGFKKLSFSHIKNNFNQQTVANLKQQLINFINKNSVKLTNGQQRVTENLNQVNAISSDNVTNDSLGEVKQQLNDILQNFEQKLVLADLEHSFVKIPPNKQHLRLYAQESNDEYYHSFQSALTNPANSINSDGSLTIKPKGYFMYNLKAINKLAPGKMINLKVLVGNINDNTKLQYSVQRKDNTYAVIITDIPKTREGVYQLSNFIVPKDAVKLSLRLDNRTGTSDAYIKSFSVTPTNNDNLNDLFTQNLIVTPTARQHIGKFAKESKDKYFASFQSLHTQTINSLNPDGSLTVLPKGYFFYNLKAVEKLAPGKSFNIRIGATQVDNNTKIEYAIYDKQNNLLVKITNIPKNEDGTYKLDNIIVPNNASRIALRIDNRKGTTSARLTGLYVVPVREV